MIAVAVAQYPPFFYQPGARIFVLESTSALAAYAVAALRVGRSKSASWDAILRVAFLFGILSGIVEALNIALENAIPAIHTPALPIAFMLAIFTSWGVAAFLFFSTPVLCFQQLAASFPKTPGWGYPNTSAPTFAPAVTCATWRLYPLSPQSIAHTFRRHGGCVYSSRALPTTHRPLPTLPI